MSIRELDLALAFGLVGRGVRESGCRQMVGCLGSCDLGLEDYFVELASRRLMGCEDGLVGCLVDLWDGIRWGSLVCRMVTLNGEVRCS